MINKPDYDEPETFFGIKIDRAPKKVQERIKKMIRYENMRERTELRNW